MKKLKLVGAWYEWMEKGRKEKCRKGKISQIKMSKTRIWGGDEHVRLKVRGRKICTSISSRFQHFYPTTFVLFWFSIFLFSTLFPFDIFPFCLFPSYPWYMRFMYVFLTPLIRLGCTFFVKNAKHQNHIIWSRFEKILTVLYCSSFY